MLAVDSPLPGTDAASLYLGTPNYTAGMQAGTAMKQVLGARMTTVFVRQGHYALASADTVIDPAPDLRIERIDQLIGLDPSHFTSIPPEHVKVSAPASIQEQT